MTDPLPPRPGFTYRAGIRLAGTVITCDGSASTELLFLSHPPVLAAHGRRALPRPGGRRQLLATDGTLTLLGAVGQRLRAQALVAAPGRPFALGDLRLELFRSDHLPGSASLLCDQNGRRLVYAGPLGDEPEVRAAAAVCVDARWAARDVELPDRAAATVALLQAARDRAGGAAPILLIDPPELSAAVAQVLAEAGLPARAHRRILESLTVYRRALGSPRPATTVQRFAGRLPGNELLLWPAAAPIPAQAMKPARVVVLVAPHAAREAARLQVGASAGVVFPFGADAGRLIRYVGATGATEVALVGAPDDHLVGLLRSRGITAYRLGPPRQMSLFS